MRHVYCYVKLFLKINSFCKFKTRSKVNAATQLFTHSICSNPLYMNTNKIQLSSLLTITHIYYMHYR